MRLKEFIDEALTKFEVWEVASADYVPGEQPKGTYLSTYDSRDEAESFVDWENDHSMSDIHILIVHPVQS